jgi:Mg/Co/Ni transporter MgtE
LELCELPEIKNSIIPIQKSTIEEAISRGRWLVGLLVLQSSSSFILDSYQELIKEHLVVTFFLTMLVGAGGNAGNQSAIKVIRGLATGTITATGDSMRKVLQQQATVALMLGTGLSAAGWMRVYLTNGNALNSTAISMSLFLIVVTSVLLGAALPFGLAKAGVDPANAGTTIQVLMDCAGVLITCVCCHYVLDTFAASLTVAVAAS